MKKITLILILCFLYSLSVKTQAPFNYIFSNRDDNFPNNADSGIRPFFWNNGVLFLGFCVDLDTDDYGISLIFYDTLGNLQWTQRIFIPECHIVQGNDIIFFNNNSFYVGGIVYQSSYYNFDVFYSKHDLYGDIIYYNINHDMISKFLVDLYKFSDDQFLALSQWDNDIGGDSNRIIIDKVDTNFNIIQTHASESNLRYPYKIIKTPDDKIYVGGTRKTTAGPQYNIKIFIDIHDLDLNYIHTNNFNLTVNDFFGSFEILHDVVFMNFMITDFIPAPREVWQIARLNAIGMINSMTSLGPTDIEPWSTSLACINDSLIISGLFTYNEEPFYLYFHDYNLTQVCSSYVHLPGVSSYDIWLADIAAVSNNKVAGTGYVYDDPNISTDSQDHWNFLVDNVFNYININCNPPIINNIEEDTINNNFSTEPIFKVYPTLIKNDININIEYLNDQGSMFQIRVYNLQGENELTTSGTENIKLNLNFLKKGIYILNISSERKFEIIKIVKT
jgi:hypothetical protein